MGFKKAQPVWEHKMETMMNRTLVFRTVIEKKGNTVLRLTGSSIYNIVVNGNFVANGPARCAHGYYRIDEILLDSFLTNNENVIAVYVGGFNVNSFYTLDQPAFLCAEIECDNEIIAFTEENGNIDAYLFEERIRKVQRYSFQRDFVEVYNLSADSQRIETDANYFGEKVILSNQIEKCFLKRNIFYPQYKRILSPIFIASGKVKINPHEERKYRDRSLYSISNEFKGFKIEELDVISTDIAENIEYSSKNIINVCDESQCLSDKEFLTIDFQQVRTGILEFNVSCKRNTKMVLMFDEILDADRNINCTRLEAANVIIWEIEKGVYTLRTFSPYTLRFATFVLIDGEIDISDVKIIEFAYSTIERDVDIKDEKIKIIYDAAVETYRQNCVDIYMDCPSRERAGWLCDSFFTARVEYLLTGKTEVEYNFLENFILPDGFKCIPKGMLPMCYPADHYDGKFIPNWAMWYVLELYEYVNNRNGNTELLEKAKGKIYELCSYFERFENEMGLLENLENWVFVEWSKANELTQNVNFPTNMLYSAMLKKVGELYNDEEKILKSKVIKNTINRISMHNGFYCDNAYRDKKNHLLTLSGECSEVCQYYAFFTDTATPETHSKLWNILVEDFGPDRKENNKWEEVYFANAFIGNYLRLEILNRYGYKDKVVENIVGYFYDMAKTTGTLWEHDKPTASLCHGFASHVLIWLWEYYN